MICTEFDDNRISPLRTRLSVRRKFRVQQFVEHVLFPGRLVLSGILLMCLILPVLSVAAADDIFAARPNKKKNYTETYPTAASFLSATESGEIPDFVQKDSSAWTKLGSPVLNILRKEYGLDSNHLYGGTPDVMFGMLVQNLTKHEFDESNEEYVRVFQRTEDQLFGKPDDKINHPFTDSQTIFKKFATQYSAAVQAYIASKKVADAEKSHQDQVTAKQATDEKQIRESQQAAAAAEKRVQDEMAAQKTAQETQNAVAEQNQRKALADAIADSLSAAEEIKAKAAQGALNRQKAIREQKLAATLASPAYKLWEAALQVQQGEELISKAQQVLDHEDAVQRESNVTDLAARRAAGEQIVAGKDLAAEAFAAYKKTGRQSGNPQCRCTRR